ncbi:serine hydrolase-like protein [Orussus abietinus]|uniref:serine hydrolase-like protein n=1 Tax=Orussus abietinus TaxID=222816 RepID=UPI0006256129|nr:serine hydrolase-like protein [Orussus abietinus]XP_012272580.1 serine hydrolase-like protein [Orussus abietinus]XP_012272589.1 serine hydrolase-like protein [Orussus abietinus]
MTRMSKEREVKELRLTVPWGHIAAKAWGSPSGDRVLMVHGILDNAGSYNRLVPLLPEHFYYVAIDLPGHGLSSSFPSAVPLEYFNYVFTIRIVLDSLQWDKCTYIGHSMGAQIGIFCAILFPERFVKIVSCDGTIPLLIHDSDLIDRLRTVFESIEASKSPANLYTRDEALYALQFLRYHVNTSDAAEALFERAVTKVGDKYMYNRDPRLKFSVKILMNVDQVLSLYKKLSVPLLTLVSTVTLDAYIYTDSEMYLKYLEVKTKMNFVLVEGNHDVHNSFPERVAPHICKYLDSATKSKL